MRTIDSNIVNAANSNGSYRVDFAKMEVGSSSSEHLLVSTLFRDITVDGDTYIGAGGLLDMSDISETLDIKQNSIRVSLAGLDQSVVDAITNTKFLGAKLTLSRGYYDESNGTLAGNTIYQVWSGLVNDYSIVYGGDIGQENKVVVSVSAKNLLVSLLERKAGRFTAPESFELFTANDKSMEFVESLGGWNPRFGKDD